MVVEDGWPVARAAKHFHVAWTTAKRWAVRYAEMGLAGIEDRSSRPHRSPHRTPPHLVRRIVHLRWKQRLSPLAISAKTGAPASTVHAVLVRCRLNRLSHVDIRTGEPIRRYEHEHPGALIHVDAREARQHPRRRRVALRRTRPGPPQQSRDARRAAQQAPRAADGHGVRAHRNGQPLTRRLRRNPRR
ncbi:helix-turn-helix domain-containing protein [Pseudokineococcus marinus]|uniref:Helix-turn-helix domain-containing protein n=1 Tax=Pseudokineococcus marinus TaxID=351215 RepID=A0A849BRH6_9ACTN|nr:helix-turn-helix domain-containing protein [Pseudokineococcus marinus]